MASQSAAIHRATSMARQSNKIYVVFKDEHSHWRVASEEDFKRRGRPKEICIFKIDEDGVVAAG